MSGEKILITEDERITALDLKMTLEKLGYLVVGSVASGEESIEYARRLKPDLVLMDIQMPEMDGYEATERIRSKGIATPIYALSANVMKNEIETASNAGLDGYLTKPLEIDELVSCLQRFLIAGSRI